MDLARVMGRRDNAAANACPRIVATVTRQFGELGFEATKLAPAPPWYASPAVWKTTRQTVSAIGSSLTEARKCRANIVYQCLRIF